MLRSMLVGRLAHGAVVDDMSTWRGGLACGAVGSVMLGSMLMRRMTVRCCAGRRLIDEPL